MHEHPDPSRTRILHLSASPGGRDGSSHRLSDYVVEHLLARHPGAELRLRMLNEEIGHVDGGYALALANKTANPGEQGSLGLSDRLIEELAWADLLVIATPMHNLTVPSSLKAWLDHVVRINRTMISTPRGKVGALPDRPVYLVISSGGWRTGEHARQPDFIEPYLRAVLPMMGLANITVFSLEATSFPDRREAAWELALAAVDSHFAAGAAPR